MDARQLSAALNAHGEHLNALFADFQTAQKQTWAAFSVAVARTIGRDALRDQLLQHLEEFTKTSPADRAQAWRNELLQAATNALSETQLRR